MTNSGTSSPSTARRTSAIVASTAVAAAALLVLSATSAYAKPSARPGTVAVAQGSGAGPLTAAAPAGTTEPSTPVAVSFILRAQHLGELEQRAQSGAGAQLSTTQFARRYGQSPAVIAHIVSYLHSYGIKTHVYSDGLDISSTGTAGEYNKALSITLKNYRVKQPAADGSGRTQTRTVHGSLADPRMPQDCASPILAILGLSNYAPFVSNAHKAVKQPARTAKSSSGVPAGLLTPADFAKRYDLTGLYKAGAKGKGVTIGIVTLAAFDPNVPTAFWNDYLGLHESASRITTVPVDGGAPGPSEDAGTDETDLDVEQSGALAPAAKLRVYTAPNTDPGFADAFFAAASDNIADTVSVSWGESETYVASAVAAGTETSEYEAAFDEAFMEFAAQGQSDFASAGDAGAYDALDDAGTTNLTVDTPADSPYLTAAGGTTLPGVQTYPVLDNDGNPTGATVSANIPAERAWGWDYLFPLASTLISGGTFEDVLAGGGGGYSHDEARPSYQQGISGFDARKYLTSTDPQEIAPGFVEPTDFTLNSTPPLSSGYAGGRGLPDVSTNADPQTGYAVYDPTLFPGGFAQYGGTSFVSPQLNGSTAVIDSALGRRVGFWNPQVYAFARSGHSPFTELSDNRLYQGVKYLYHTAANGTKTALPGSFANDNLYYTGKPGTTWNPAVGLGTPNLAALAKAFARH